jgi:PPP family 3-phenylpropionic acid transporter
MGALSLLLLPSSGHRKTSDTPSRHLWLSPRFLVVAAGAALIQSSHGLYYGFSAIDWRSRGLGSGEVGFLWAIGIAAEIVFFAISGRMKLAPLALLGLGAGGALIRWIGLSFGPIGPALPLLQCLHALSFGATHLGSVQFAARVAGQQQTATAQADFGLILALGGATATGFSGVLYAGMGDHGYLVMAAMAATGGVLLVLSRRLSN